MLDINFLFAQLSIGNDNALQIINNSLELSTQTIESWQELWDLIIDVNQPLWLALCDIGNFIATLSLIYVLLNQLSNRNNTIADFIDLVKFILFFVLMSANNGYYLIGIILYIRNLGLYWNIQVLQMTFAGVSISQAIAKVQNTSVANSRVRQIFNDCVNLTGTNLAQCIQDPNKQEQVAQLSQSFAVEPLNGSALEMIFNSLTSGLSLTINVIAINIMQLILNCLQWCFVNTIEASLLLSAIYAPIALALTLSPFGERNILKWSANYFTLILMNLGYVILIGIIAIVLTLVDRDFVQLGSTNVDIAFLLFISIFAPIIAVKTSESVGSSIYDSLGSGQKQLLTASVAIATLGFSKIVTSDSASPPQRS